MIKHKVPVGTRLRCINANMNLTEGKIYTVVGYDDNCDNEGCYIINDLGDNSWRFYHRFEIVSNKYLKRIEE